MKYTKDLLITTEKQTEDGVLEESTPSQVIFDLCVLRIHQNTPDSNNDLRLLLAAIPELASIKNSNNHGLTLLIYAVGFGNVEAAKIIAELTTDLNAVDDSYQQTALHQAVYKNHLEMVELLIQQGANVNIQDQNKQTPLWMASINGNLDLVQKITAVSGVELDIDNDLFSPLHVATINGHLDVVKHLVDLGVDINKQGDKGKTPLHIATDKHPEIAKFLISRGANANIKDSADQTSLYIAAVLGNVELVALMIEKGADPYLLKHGQDTVLDAALDRKNINLLKALWNKDNTRSLYQAIIDNDKEKTDHILSENQFTEQELRVIFVSAVNHHKFDAATMVLDHPCGLKSKYPKARSPEQDLVLDTAHGVTRKALYADILDIYKDNFSNLIFEGTAFEGKKEAVLDAFAKICELLADVPSCVELLKPIEEELAALFPELSNIEAEKENIKSLFWPTAAPENYQPLDKKGALRKILRSQLQKHNIETQDQMYNFTGFVKAEKANEIVRAGGLFKEQFLMGNALTHGVYSHYFQWFLISRAIESGRIELQGGLTLKDILQASVDVKTPSDNPAWTPMIDNVTERPYAGSFDKVRICNPRFFYDQNNPTRYRFSSVAELSSFLYTSSDLPHLRGYLLDSLYKNIKKIQIMMKDKFPEDPQIEQEHIIGGQIISFWAFNRFKLGLSKEDVDKYYKQSAKTDGKLDLETGIVAKSIPKQWTAP